MLAENRRNLRCRALYLLIVLLPLLVITADATLRARQAGRTARRWFNALDLSAPALWPAGTPVRHPETVCPAVDLRFSPLQPTGSDIGGSGTEFSQAKVDRP